MQIDHLGSGKPEDLRHEEYQNYAVMAEDGESRLLRLDLRGSLELAAKYSRDYQSAKETLYISALTLLGQANEWDWNPVNNFSGLWGIKQNPSSSILNTDSSLGFSKRFFSGARLSANIGLQTLRYLSGDRFSQPDQPGHITVSSRCWPVMGRRLSREPLTQAEAIWSMRAHYVRSREALLIKHRERYYAVLNARESLNWQAAYQSVASSL